MRKILIIITILIAVFIPLITWLLWVIESPKEINVFVMDKTVLNHKAQEHSSLFWVLKNEKFIKPNQESHQLNQDYFGFFPDGEGKYVTKDFTNYNDKSIDSLSNVYDAAFYTDMYGIYSNEWNYEYFSDGRNRDTLRINSDRSVLMYGGLSKNDMSFLKQMKRKKKLILAEFNIIASPTSHSVRRNFEKTFDVKWSGWVGRFFDNLDTTVNMEIPRWLINNYLKNNEEWPFKNSGIVFVRNDDKIVILENEASLTVETPMIETEEQFVDEFGMVDVIKYPFWFDIVSTEQEDDIVSKYHIYTNAHGDSILKKWHLPNQFPALIHHNFGSSFYYLAGDFSDNPISMWTSSFKYVHWFSNVFYSSASIEREGFFWNYYRPFIKTVFDKHHLNYKPVGHE